MSKSVWGSISDRRAGVKALGWAILLGLAIGVRLNGLGRSLWLDEAWVANSALSSSLHDVLYYKSWLQTTPPAFILAVHWLSFSLPVNNSTLRLLPLLMSIAAILLFAKIAHDEFRTSLALVATGLFAFCPEFVLNSHSLKQYAGEVLMAVCLLYAFLAFMKRPGTIPVWGWSILFVCSLTIAYGSVFISAGFLSGAMYLSAGKASTNSIRWAPFNLPRGIVVSGMVVLLTLLTLTAVFVVPNSSKSLRSFWALPADLGFSKRVSAIYVWFLTLFDYIPSFGLFGEGRMTARIKVVTTLMVIGGLLVIALARFRRSPHDAKNQEFVAVSTFCVLPILGLIFCASLSIYPFAPRTGLIVLPGFIYWISYLTVFVREDISVLQRVPDASWGWPFRSDVLLASLGLCAIAIQVPLLCKPVPAEADMENAVRYLRTNVLAGDIVYVHAAAVEEFKLYQKIEGSVHGLIAYGDSGWPCCARGKEFPALPDPDRPRSDLRAHIRDGYAGRIWLVHSRVGGLWTRIGQDEEEIQTDLFAGQDCADVGSQRFSGIAIACFVL